MIFIERFGPGRLARQIDILDDGFRITDQLKLTGDVKKIYRAVKFSLRHVASSKYFAFNELDQVETLDWDGSNIVSIERFVRWDTKGKTNLIDVSDANLS